MGQETGLQSQEEEVGVQEGGLKRIQHMKPIPLAETEPRRV